MAEIRQEFKQAPTDFFSSEPIGIQGVVKDLPEAGENFKEVFAEIDNRERQSLIEQGLSELGLPEPEKPDDIFSQIQNQLTNSSLMQMMGGTRDTVINTIESLGDLVELGIPGAGEAVRGVTEKVPEIPKGDKLENEILRTATQYATNFIPLMRGLKIVSAIPKVGRTVQSATAGMLTAFTALDVDTPKFGEMIESLHPKLKIPLLDFLKAKEDDTNAEKRFKNSIDDALAFGAIGGTFFAIGKFVKHALALGKKFQTTITKPKVTPKPKIKPEGAKDKKPLIVKKAKPETLVKVTAKTGEKLKDFLEIKAKDVELAKGELNLNFENWKVEDDIVTSLNKIAAVFEEEVKAMGRGIKKSSKELLKEIESSGFGMKEMLELNKNQPLNDVQMKSFIATLYHLQVKLEKLKVAFKAGDEAAGEEFAKLFALSGKLTPKFLGATSTAGRALKAVDTMTQDFDGNLRVIKDLINSTEEIPTGLKIPDLIRAHDLIPTVKGRSMFARIATGAVDMFAEGWIAGLVSGTKTVFGVNTLGNLSLSVFGVSERALAAGYKSIFRGGQNGIAPQEAHYLLYGMINSIDEALQVAGKTLRTGIQNPEFTKFDIPRQITGDRINLNFIDNKLTQNILKQGIDLMGEIIRGPFRLLGTVDDFFKVINTRGHLWSLGARKANSMGLSPDSEEWVRVVSDIINNPTKRLADAANDFGHIQTFTNVLNKKGAGFIEGAGATIGEFSNNHLAMKIVVPFSKIATNITKYTLERTPFAFVMKDTRAAIGRGGADRQMAFAKIALGSAIGTLAAYMANAGLITGTFPTSSQNQKQLKRDSGTDQNSFIIGGKSFPYRRLDPIGMTFGMAADFVELAFTLGFDDLSKIATVISTLIGENVLNKSYLVGIADVMDAVLGRRTPTKVMQRLASTLIPFSSLIREIERSIDPTIGETNPKLPSMWERFINGFMSGKPGENRYLMPKRTFWGEVLKRERYFDIKNIKDDRALEALIENEVEVSFRPDRAISGRMRGILRKPSARDGIILGDPHYDRMIELFGKIEIGGLIVREAIIQLLDNPLFKEAPKSLKREQLESVIRVFRDTAELKMIDEDTQKGGTLQRRIDLKKLAEIRE